MPFVLTITLYYTKYYWYGHNIPNSFLGLPRRSKEFHTTWQFVTRHCARKALGVGADS